MNKRRQECHYCSELFKDGGVSGEGLLCCHECAPIQKLALALKTYCPKPGEPSFRVEGRGEKELILLSEIKKILCAYEFMIAPSLSSMSSIYSSCPRGELEILYLDEKEEATLQRKQAHKIYFDRVYWFLRRAFGDESCPMSIAYLRKLFLESGFPSLEIYKKEGKGERKVKPFPALERIGAMKRVLRRGEAVAEEARSWEEGLFLQAGEAMPSEDYSFSRLKRACESAFYIYCAFVCALGESKLPSLERNAALLETMEKIILRHEPSDTMAF